MSDDFKISCGGRLMVKLDDDVAFGPLALGLAGAVLDSDAMLSVTVEQLTRVTMAGRVNGFVSLKVVKGDSAGSWWTVGSLMCDVEGVEVREAGAPDLLVGWEDPGLVEWVLGTVYRWAHVFDKIK